MLSITDKHIQSIAQTYVEQEPMQEQEQAQNQEHIQEKQEKDNSLNKRNKKIKKNEQYFAIQRMHQNVDVAMKT